MDILLSGLLEHCSYDAGSRPGFSNKLEVYCNCGSTTAVTTRSEVTGKQVEQHTAHSTYDRESWWVGMANRIFSLAGNMLILQILLLCLIVWKILCEM